MTDHLATVAVRFAIVLGVFVLGITVLWLGAAGWQVRLLLLAEVGGLMDVWTLISLLLTTLGLLSLILSTLEQLDPYGRGESLWIIGMVLAMSGGTGMIVRWLA